MAGNQAEYCIHDAL